MPNIYTHILHGFTIVGTYNAHSYWVVHLIFHLFISFLKKFVFSVRSKGKGPAVSVGIKTQVSGGRSHFLGDDPEIFKASPAHPALCINSFLFIFWLLINNYLMFYKLNGLTHSLSVINEVVQTRCAEGYVDLRMICTQSSYPSQWFTHGVHHQNFIPCLHWLDVKAWG